MREVEAVSELIENVTGQPGFSSFAEIKVGAVEIGRVEMILERRPELVQLSGYFHGGVISGLADHAAGAAVTSALPEGRFCLTACLQVNYLAPADGDRLIADARAIRVGGSICTAQVDVSVVDPA